MFRMEPITAAELRMKPEEYRKQQIENSIQHIYQQVVQQAIFKTSYFHEIPQSKNKVVYRRDYANQNYVVSPEEMVEALKEKLIDCRIEYSTIWVEVTPGTKQEKTGILIDWS